METGTREIKPSYAFLSSGALNTAKPVARPQEETFPFKSSI